jgi:ADP-ribosyl-[dinitrogen reductase] hydrolase
MAILSCRETHDSIAAECVTGMFAAVLFAALRGFDKTNICAYAEKGVYAQNEEYDKFWVDNVDLLINRWKNNRRDELRDLGGYIVDTYAIALWGFVNSSSFEDGMRKVLCLGGDSDTNAACYGQLAGAFYGYEAIPKEWRDDVYDAKEIVRLADALIKMESCPVLQTRFEDDEDFRSIKQSDIDKSVEYYARSSEPMSITELLKARFKKKT